jgi:hypothetical protein
LISLKHLAPVREGTRIPHRKFRMLSEARSPRRFKLADDLATVKPYTATDARNAFVDSFFRRF